MSGENAISAVGGILLWVVVVAGLAYGVIQTGSKVVQLFG